MGTSVGSPPSVDAEVSIQRRVKVDVGNDCCVDTGVSMQEHISTNVTNWMSSDVY